MTETPPARPRPDLDRPLVAFGVALLAAAVVLSSSYARARGDLDGSVFAVGVLATVGLLGVAAVGALVAGTRDGSTDLVGWPGAFGTIGAGVMVAVAIEDGEAATYAGGTIVACLAVIGLVLSRSSAFVVPIVLGVFVVYLQLLDDVLGDGDGLPGVKVAIALALFAVAATAAVWSHEKSRVLGGAVVGALTVVGFAALTGVLAIDNALSVALDFHTEDTAGLTYTDYRGGMPDGPTDDGWTILALAVLLMLLWCACAALSGHVAYRLLVVAMAVTVIPLVTRVLLVEHPTWWGVVAAAVGGAVLIVAGLRVLRAPDSP